MSKWNDEWYVLCYQMAREGMSDVAIADGLGVASSQLYKWRKEKPALQKSFDLGRSKGGVKQFEEYVYGRLPERLKAVWERMESAENGSAEEFLERCVGDCTIRDRQRLWLHALMTSNFNYDTACRKTGISRATADTWGESDPSFLDLVDQMRVARKDWIEGGLMDLVARRDVSAVIFANKTQNADRGYNPAKQLKIDQTRRDEIDVKVFMANIPAELVGVVVEALEKAKQPAQLPPMGTSGHPNQPKEVLDVA